MLVERCLPEAVADSPWPFQVFFSEIVILLTFGSGNAIRAFDWFIFVFRRLISLILKN